MLRNTPTRKAPHLWLRRMRNFWLVLHFPRPECLLRKQIDPRHRVNDSYRGLLPALFGGGGGAL